MTKYIFGEVSSATMRNEDLIPCFADVLEALADENNCSEDYLEYIKEAQDMDYDSEYADYFLNEVLFEKLNDFAAPFHYFGFHEGDGACYGFWLSNESLEEAIADGEVLKIDDMSKFPVKEHIDAEYILHVTDHGNITLYSRNQHEIWSYV